MGAKKFVEGLGKHGKFNVNDKVTKQEWEKEFEQMEKEEKSSKQQSQKPSSPAQSPEKSNK